MSLLVVMPETEPDKRVVATRDGQEIARVLGEAGVRFERWRAAVVGVRRDLLSAVLHELGAAEVVSGRSVEVR